MSAQPEIRRAAPVVRRPEIAVVDEVATAPGGYPWKRAFDVVFSAGVLIVGAPVYLVLALLVAVTSPGPVLYRSTRIGRGGREFGCLKFRTMVVDADERLETLLRERPAVREEYGRTLKLKDDPRITRIGGFLRRTSLDELPQFWNVLKGDMSVVGPRPLLLDEPAKYGDALDEVLNVRPGLTGPWQVSGRNDLEYGTRVALARDYACENSFLGDLRMIALTPLVMVRGGDSGAY